MLVIISRDDDDDTSFKKITKKRIYLSRVEFPWPVSSDLKSLLCGLLEKDPLKRWDFAKIEDNSWFRSDLYERKEDSIAMHLQTSDVAKFPEIEVMNDSDKSPEDS